MENIKKLWSQILPKNKNSIIDHLDEKVFFGGPGAVLGVAASMAGVDRELSVSLPDGSEGIEYLPIDGSQCFAEIRRLKSALVRFTRAITMRCLGLKSVPIGMK